MNSGFPFHPSSPLFTLSLSFTHSLTPLLFATDTANASNSKLRVTFQNTKKAVENGRCNLVSTSNNHILFAFIYHSHHSLIKTVSFLHRIPFQYYNVFFCLSSLYLYYLSLYRRLEGVLFLLTGQSTFFGQIWEKKKKEEKWLRPK